MTLGAWSQFRGVLEQWAPLGICMTASGARLIGHVPHVAELAYLHSLYPGLSPAELDDLVGRMCRPIPMPYAAFLRLTNGAKLFSGSLALSGLRRNYVRNTEQARQPYALEIDNMEHRPGDAPQDAFIIGGYSYDGSLLWIDQDLRVHRSAQACCYPILNTWSSFDEMLLAEVDRLATLFDKSGRMRNGESETVPAPQYEMPS